MKKSGSFSGLNVGQAMSLQLSVISSRFSVVGLYTSKLTSNNRQLATENQQPKNRQLKTHMKAPDAHYTRLYPQKVYQKCTKTVPFFPILGKSCQPTL